MKRLKSIYVIIASTIVLIMTLPFITLWLGFLSLLEKFDEVNQKMLKAYKEQMIYHFKIVTKSNKSEKQTTN